MFSWLRNGLKKGGVKKEHSLAGSLLISSTEMEDPQFSRTVILVIHHNASGAFGLMINRRSRITFGEAMPEYSEMAIGRMPMYLGGPVQPQAATALHSGLPEELLGSDVLSPCINVNFEPLFPTLVEYLHQEWQQTQSWERPTVRLFAGYSGWGGGQLEDEIRKGGWVVRPASVKHIFHPDPNREWHDALCEMGDIYRVIGETGVVRYLN